MAKRKAAKVSSKASKTNVKMLKMRFRARPPGNKTSKPRRGFGDPVAAPAPKISFVAIPSSHKLPTDLSYDLADAVDAGVIQTITTSGKLAFHSVGDTGDINGLGITRDLAEQMETQVTSGGGVLRKGSSASPQDFIRT